MNELKCPKCGTIFKISENDYNSILEQVRNDEFEKELKRREEEFQKEKENSIKLAEAKVKEELSKQLNEKESQIGKKEIEISEKEMKIVELTKQMEIVDSNKKFEIQKAVNEKDKEIDSLTNKIELTKNEFELKIKEHELKEQSLKEQYESKLKDKDEQIAYYKDFKAKQSTKMIGESLEQHCNLEFNRLRPLFKNASFEKDNDIKSGSKGDFIYRDYDDDGNEIVSIMFEMKNEADETATKHKNEDFLKELDKDRRQKNCEYAVLVSLLEIDNDYYNDGIIDVSHIYEKMYVIRPQFFIPLITLIRNLASKSLEYRKELENIKNQNIDITNFEEKMNAFKDSFGRNYRLASEKFQKAIEEIDKTIVHLQKTKEALLSSEKNLTIANNKADELSIKRLTANNPTMRKKFNLE